MTNWPWISHCACYFTSKNVKWCRNIGRERTTAYGPKLALIKKPVGIFDSVIYVKFIARSFTLKSFSVFFSHLLLGQTQRSTLLLGGCWIGWMRSKRKLFNIRSPFSFQYRFRVIFSFTSREIYSLMVFEMDTDAPKCTGHRLIFEIMQISWKIQRGVAIISISQFSFMKFPGNTVGQNVEVFNFIFIEWTDACFIAKKWFLLFFFVSTCQLEWVVLTIGWFALENTIILCNHWQLVDSTNYIWPM